MSPNTKHSVKHAAKRMEPRYVKRRQNGLAVLIASIVLGLGADLPERIAALTEKLRAAEKEIEALHKAQLLSQAGQFLAQAQEVNGFSLIALRLPQGVAGGDLRTLATDIVNRVRDDAAVVLLGSDTSGKFPYIAAATASAIARGVSSGGIVKLFGEFVDGKGGGKPDMAQGSGTTPSGAEQGFDAVKDFLQTL